MRPANLKVLAELGLVGYPKFPAEQAKIPAEPAMQSQLKVPGEPTLGFSRVIPKFMQSQTGSVGLAEVGSVGCGVLMFKKTEIQKTFGKSVYFLHIQIFSRFLYF